MMAWLAACTPPDPDPTSPSGPVGRATLEAGAPFVGPVRRLVVELAAPAPLRVELSGDDDVRTLDLPSAAAHEVPLIGLLPGVTYDLVVTAGNERWELPFDAEALPTGGVPDLEVLALDPERAEPGWTLFSFALLGPGFANGVLLLDERLRVRWWWLDENGRVDDDLVVAPDGLLWRRHHEELTVADWLGRVERQYLVDPPEGVPNAFLLGSGRNHHDTVPLADGTFWALGFDSIEAEVPLDYGSPETRVATVQDAPVYHLAADGSVIDRFSTVALLEPGRCGWGCLSEEEFGIDLGHANALEIVPGDGFLVTMRNQDVAVRVEEDGEVRWRYGDPAGWTGAWAASFLAPVGDPSWPYHGHGVDLLEDGTLVLFDNHNGGGTPYGPGDDSLSRVHLSRVDEEARTVELLHTDDQTAVGPLYSFIVGDADLLPETGNVLAVWGAVARENGVLNLDLGLGRNSSHVVEVDPERPGEPVFHLRLTAPGDPWAEGVFVYRAERVSPPLGG